MLQFAQASLVLSRLKIENSLMTDKLDPLSKLFNHYLHLVNEINIALLRIQTEASIITINKNLTFET